MNTLGAGSKRPAKRARKDPGRKENKVPKDGSSDDKKPEDIKEIPPASGKCYLLDELPSEVRNYIWKLSVIVDDPIVPIQLCHKSNKFLWSKSQSVYISDGKGNPKRKVSAVQPLAAVQLNKVCHQLYDEVSSTHLFYSLNEFHFETADPNNPTTYLLAITEPRRNAIRSITCEWPRGYYEHNPAQMFTVIATCQKLQVLNLKIGFHIGNYNLTDDAKHPKLPGLAESKVAVRGIKKLTLDLLPRPTWYQHQHDEDKSRRNTLESLLAGEMAKPRGNEYNLRIFAQAQLGVNLDIHGTGRLSGDKKPNIASRTRQQLRNVEKVTDQGTMPKRKTPKYDLNGDLAWYVLGVEESRKVLEDDGGSSVEFRVKCYPESNPRRRYLRTENKGTITSWEAVSVLHSASVHWDIVHFYSKHRTAFGKQETRDVWELRSEDDEKVARQHASALKQLDTLIKKEAQLEEAARLEQKKVEKQNLKATKAAARITAIAKKGARGSKASKGF